MLLSANNANSSHLSWPSNQINKNAGVVEISVVFFPETFRNARHIFRLHFHHEDFEILLASMDVIYCCL